MKAGYTAEVGAPVAKRLGVIAAVTALVLLIGGIAYASIPGPDGVIHGCYKTSSPGQGALTTIDSGATCPSGYTALNWEAGPRPGTPYGLHIDQSDTTVPADGTQQVIFVGCPTGEQAVSGNFFVNDTPGVTGGIRPYEPAHNYAGTPVVPVRGFYVYVDAPSVGQSAASLHSELLCARMA